MPAVDTSSSSSSTTSTTSSHTSPGFGNKLAHTDKKVRDKAFYTLSQWLSTKPDISDLDLMKLWKGLFYCFWMSDKSLIQQHFADQLAKIILSLPDESALRFVKTFWKTMVAEWHGVDRFRLDKFYFLFRKFHFYTFKYLESKEFASPYMDEFLNIIMTGPLESMSDKTPNSIRYHTTESYLDELQKSCFPTKKPMYDTENHSLLINSLLKPFWKVLFEEIASGSLLLTRVKEEIFMKFIEIPEQDGQEELEPTMTESQQEFLQKLLSHLETESCKSTVPGKNMKVLKGIMNAYREVLGLEMDLPVYKVPESVVLAGNGEMKKGKKVKSKRSKDAMIDGAEVMDAMMVELAEAMAVEKKKNGDVVEEDVEMTDADADADADAEVVQESKTENVKEKETKPTSKKRKSQEEEPKPEDPTPASMPTLKKKKKQPTPTEVEPEQPVEEPESTPKPVPKPLKKRLKKDTEEQSTPTPTTSTEESTTKRRSSNKSVKINLDNNTVKTFSKRDPLPEDRPTTPSTPLPTKPALKKHSGSILVSEGKVQTNTRLNAKTNVDLPTLFMTGSEESAVSVGNEGKKKKNKKKKKGNNAGSEVRRAGNRPVAADFM